MPTGPNRRITGLAGRIAHEEAGRAAAFAAGGGALRDESRQLAELHGRALVELATAVGSSRWLRMMRASI